MVPAKRRAMAAWARFGISVLTLICCFILLLQLAELRLSRCQTDHAASARAIGGSSVQLHEAVQRLESRVQELASEMRRNHVGHVDELRAIRTELPGLISSSAPIASNGALQRLESIVQGFTSEMRRSHAGHVDELRAIRTEFASLISSSARITSNGEDLQIPPTSIVAKDLRGVASVTQNPTSDAALPIHAGSGQLWQTISPSFSERLATSSASALTSNVATMSSQAPTSTGGDRGPVGERRAIEPVVLAFVGEVERKAEDQYWYQRKEKNKPIHPAFARYGANWPCIWGEESLGTSTGDGSKWTCGVRLLKQPCIVYSFGSRGDIAFEHGMVLLGSSCEIHIYDPTADEPTQARQLGLKYHKIGLDAKDGEIHLGSTLHPVRSLRSLMRENKHDFIDILKVDIDFSEHRVIAALDAEGWPSVAQLLLEVHIEQQNFNGRSLDELVDLVERAGFRLFHHEVNWEYGATCCIEYAFIQKDWRPGKRSYKMKSDTPNIRLEPSPQHPHLVDKYLMGLEP